MVKEQFDELYKFLTSRIIDDSVSDEEKVNAYEALNNLISSDKEIELQAWKGGHDVQLRQYDSEIAWAKVEEKRIEIGNTPPFNPKRW
jgi:hypothetical protein